MSHLSEYSSLILPWVYAGVLFLVGLASASLLSRGTHRFMLKHANAHQAMIMRRLVFFSLLILFVISALQQVGFKLSVLLGAAGIFTVALGFASQTSVANVISGVFLLLEKSFAVGDLIQVKSIIGRVESIDLLSVKVVAADNRYIRLPNDMLIKSEIINLTRYPVRRVDLQLGVAYKEDIAAVKACLEKVAKANKYALAEPAAKFYFQAFAESSIDLQFSVWAKKEEYLNLKNSMQQEIKIAFEVEGIEFPFPQRVIQMQTVD